MGKYLVEYVTSNTEGCIIVLKLISYHLKLSLCIMLFKVFKNNRLSSCSKLREKREAAYLWTLPSPSCTSRSYRKGTLEKE
jgi:hypothetical protein